MKHFVIACACALGLAACRVAVATAVPADRPIAPVTLDPTRTGTPAVSREVRRPDAGTVERRHPAARAPLAAPAQARETAPLQGRWTWTP
ncbi:MAG: hypothetical protein ABW277_07385 [Longimicrobiaceae bacterium]